MMRHTLSYISYLYYEIVSVLLEFGADVDQYDFYKTTALHKACAIDSAACIEALVQGRPNLASKVSEDIL